MNSLSAKRRTKGLVLAGVIASLAAFGPSAISAQDASQPAASPAPPPPPEGSVGGLGDVNLFPRRIVINGRREIATVGIYNKTANDGDYEIKIVDMAMTPEGRVLAFDNGLDEETKAEVKTASAMLRYSPRRVTLRGSESQLIRVMARAPAELPPGEYRSHFLVSAVPPMNRGFSIDSAVGNDNANGIGVTIRPRFGISIPVIVRIGETTLDVGITNPIVLTNSDGSKALSLTVTRSGTRSAYGDIVVTANGSSKPVALTRGVGIYPEVDSRQVTIPFEEDADPRFFASGARLKIEFIDDDFKPGAKLATQEFQVP